MTLGPDQPQQAQSPPQPAWARPPATVEWRETVPLEYHQLLRGTPRYRWWKPLLALVLGVIYYLTFQVAFLVPVMGIYAATNGGMSIEDLNGLVLPDTQNPWSIFTALMSIVLMIPAVWLVLLSTGLPPLGRVWSVALRIRWRWIGRTILPAIVALVAINVVGILLEVALTGFGSGSAVESVPDPAPPEIDLSKALISLLLVVLLVPFQATAEELVYRGVFIQVLGGWLAAFGTGSALARFMRGPVIPIVVPAVLFGLSHIYDIWGLLAVTAMALAAGWLAWRTGGLEAAITIHVVNNLVAFGFMSFGFGGETGQTVSGGTLGSLIGQVAGLMLYCWWVDRDFMRRDASRTRIDVVQVRTPRAPVAAAATSGAEQ